jgi:imidazolonepropionase-like amidohydrolase|nr:MAG: amidohydrolase [Bacteroidota bacterium]
MIRHLVSIALAGLLATGLAYRVHAQGIPPSRTGTFALTNARIVTVSGGVIERGTLLIQNGKIAALGPNVTIPSGAEVIDCSGLSIYPGLINSYTQVGLIEIGQVPETRDENEVGNYNPHMLALTAINPASTHIPVTRVNGVTTVISAPTGGLLSGQATLINLHGYTPEQMAVRPSVGVVLNFPSMGRRSLFQQQSQEERRRQYEQQLRQLNELWRKAVVYNRAWEAYERNPSGEKPLWDQRLEALRPVVRGELPFIINVNAERDILAAIRWVKENQIKAIFAGVAEGWRVADSLAQAGIPCIVGPVLAMPTRPYDRYDRAYANAALLARAGVKIAIGTFDYYNARNLAHHAGMAAAFGLSREEALKAITLYPAQIWGVADRMGSLEVGKDATLIVTDGDPLEIRTQIRYLFINGWMVPLVSRHTQLWEEYRNRAF